MANSDNEVRMMMSVYPGAMTGFAAMNAGLSSILNVFNGMTRAFDQQFGLVDAALTTTSVVVTQLGVDAMNAFGQFEQGMKIVQMVSGQTASDMDYLKQKANEFSVEYRTDIDQITEGLQTLGRAGLNTASEQAEVLENGLTTAKLEGRELNSVLQELLQNTTLLGGDLKSNEFGEQSEYVNDLLVATSMTAPITTHDISETLKYSGGIAAAAGAKIDSEEGKAILEDYMGTIAAFAQKGVTGSIAGTALRAFMNKPATQDSSVTEALASIHLKPEYLWEEGEETMKPISQQIALIQNQMDELNVSTMDRLQIWSKIVGGKMGQQMMKLDSEDIKNITKDIQAADDAENLAANSMKTYEANVKAAKESMAGLQREVGEKLVMVANPWLEFINKILEFLNNDFVSMPLAAGIIAFTGYLFNQIRSVAGLIRTEISSLLSLAQDARGYIHQSMTGRAQLDKRQVGSFISMKSKTTQKKSWSEKAASEAGTESAKDFKEYWKQYSVGVKESSPLSYTSLQKSGIVGDRLAAISRLQDLRSVDEFGLRDQDYVAAAMRYGYLSKEQEAKLISGAQQGMTARQLFNHTFGDRESVEFEILKQKLLEDAEASKALGYAIDNEARARAALLQTFGTKEGVGIPKNFYSNQISKFNNQMNEAMVKTFGSNSTGPFASKGGVGIAQDTYANQIARAINQGAIKSAESIKFGGEQVVVEFNEMMAAISQSVQGTGRDSPRKIHVGPYSLVDYEKMKNDSIPVGGMPSFFSSRGDNMSARDIWYLNKGLEAMLNPPKEQSPEEKEAEKQRRQELRERKRQPQYPQRGDPQAEYYNRLALKEKFPNIIATPSEQDAKAKELGLGKYAEDKTVKMPGPRSGPENVALGSGIEEQKRQMILQQNLAIEEAIKQELLTIANYLKKQEMVKKLREDTAKADKKALENVQKRKNLTETINKAKAANTALENRQQYQQEVAKAKKALNTAGTGYPTRMSTSSPNQVHTGTIPFVDAREASESKKQQEFQNRVQKRINRLHEAQAARLERENADREAAYQRQNIRQSYYRLGEDQRKLIASAEFEDFKQMKNLRSRVSGIPSYITNTGFVSNFSNRINRDRTGSFLSFGKEWDNNAKAYRSATKGIGGLANKALSASEAIGGPFMIAMMAIPALINLWKGAFEDFCNDLKEAGDNVKEAYSKVNSAEDALEATYRNQNPDATNAEIDQMVYDTYATMADDFKNAVEKDDMSLWLGKMNLDAEQGPEYEYDEEIDDGTLKRKKEEEKDEATKNADAIKENTGALYMATAELNTAISRLSAKMTDSWWGLDGWTGWLTDQWGGAMDKIFKGGSKFIDDNEFLLTQSQADENYSGYTEMAGLMMEDFKDAGGNWIAGMRTMMGDDVEDLSALLSKSTKDWMKSLASKEYGGIASMSARDNAKIQTSMKNDPKSWKKLAKEYAKLDVNKKTGKSTDKNLQTIKGLTQKIQSGLTKGFNETHIKQAAYLIQMQEMYNVAQNTMVPIMSTNTSLAGSTLLAANGIGSATGETASNAGGTWGTAQVISALVSIIAKSKAKEIAWQTAYEADPDSADLNGDGHDSTDEAIIKLAQETKSADEFAQEAAKRYNTQVQDLTPYNNHGVYSSDHPGGGSNAENMAPALFIAQIYEAAAKMTGYGYSADAANAYAQQAVKDVAGKPLNEIYNTFGKNYTANPAFQQKLIDNYLAASDDDNEGSGGSGGSGSGSGDKDKDTGTKKERVDLVLCNKKEIPKLNVNLFKKAPSFTILNKNFKLRDIKVNTQDKPKAVLASIKNAIIDVQKRTDPKIIQDEEAEYDPVAATDGNQTPSGSTGTSTDE